MITLHRYKRHYKLQLKPSTSKIQLVEVSVWEGGGKSSVGMEQRGEMEEKTIAILQGIEFLGMLEMG